jgi:hypothetical protein
MIKCGTLRDMGPEHISYGGSEPRGKTMVRNDADLSLLVGSHGVHEPKLFVNYTISEDLTGSDNANCRNLLKAFGKRSRRRLHLKRRDSWHGIGKRGKESVVHVDGGAVLLEPSDAVTEVTHDALRILSEAFDQPSGIWHNRGGRILSKLPLKEDRRPKRETHSRISPNTSQITAPNDALHLLSEAAKRTSDAHSHDYGRSPSPATLRHYESRRLARPASGLLPPRPKTPHKPLSTENLGIDTYIPDNRPQRTTHTPPPRALNPLYYSLRPHRRPSVSLYRKGRYTPSQYSRIHPRQPFHRQSNFPISVYATESLAPY